MSAGGIIVCQVAEVRIGIALKEVVEVLRMVELLPLPGLPAFYLGALDYHGTMVPVIDLSRRLRLAGEDVPEYERHLVVLGPPAGESALAVDRVVDVFEDQSAAAPSPVDASILTGLVQDRSGHVPILNTERLFGTKHHVRLRQMLARGRSEVGR